MIFNTQFEFGLSKRCVNNNPNWIWIEKTPTQVLEYNHN